MAQTTLVSEDPDSELPDIKGSDQPTHRIQLHGGWKYHPGVPAVLILLPGTLREKLTFAHIPLTIPLFTVWRVQILRCWT